MMGSSLSYSYGIAFVGTVVLTWLLRPVAVRCGLLDRPCGRKTHSGEVPLVGGLAMAGGACVALLVWDIHPGFLAAATILVLAGAWDDRFEITASRKLLAQAAAAIVMVTSGGVALTNLETSTSSAGVNLNWMFPLTILIAIGVINAINFVDGVDGLAGALCFVALVSMAILAGHQGLESSLRLTLILLAAVTGFLCFNLRSPWCRRAWVFMGDAGSMFLGFTLSWLAINLSQGEAGSMNLVTTLWILAVPLFDMASLMLRRLLNGCSPFSADREHFHHLLLRAGFSVGQTLTILLGIAISCAGFGLLGFYLSIPEGVMLLLLLGGFFLYLLGVLHVSTLAHTGGSNKIIFLNRFFYPDISATSQLLSDLAFELASSGLEIHVITSRQLYDTGSRELRSEDEVQGVKVTRVYSCGSGRGAFLVRIFGSLSFFVGTGWRLLRLVRKGDVVVALTDPPLISVMAAPIVRVRGAQLVNWVHDVFPEVATALKVPCLRGRLASALGWLRDATLRSACLNVVLGQSMRGFLLGRTIQEERIRVISNWADGEALWPSPSETNRLRRQWGLEGKFVIGYSGNFGRAHEFGTLLDAAEYLKNDERFRFLLIGDGAQHSWLVEEKERRRLDNVVLRPYQPRRELGTTLGAADVHLVSLRPELEGLVLPCKFCGVTAVGRPTIFIGNPHGEIGSQVVSEGCGVAVRVGDAEVLADQIRHLYGDQQGRLQMGHRARDLFERRFQKSVAVGAWRETLWDLGLRMPGRQADMLSDRQSTPGPSTVSPSATTERKPNGTFHQLPLPI